MTVCCASIFAFNYATEPGKQDYGPAIIAASDRMWTDPGLRIEYEGRVKKRVKIGETWGLVAGAITTHSTVIYRVQDRVGPNADSLTTTQVADIYAEELRHYTAERAEQLLLSPYGLRLPDLFKLDSELTRDLRASVDAFSGRTEFDALLMGVSDRASLISINQHGLLTCHDDIGFAAIGNGDIHAVGYFMQTESASLLPRPYYAGLWRTFSAKKRAEVAPGVGTETDLIVITRNGAFEPHSETRKMLEVVYARQAQEARALEPRITQELEEAGHPLTDYGPPLPEKLESPNAGTTAAHTHAGPAQK